MAHTTAYQIALKECYTRSVKRKEKMRDGSKNGECQRTHFHHSIPSDFVDFSQRVDVYL